MLLFALVAHEYAHGWAAYRQGDDTAYKLGRLTLNPIPHIDPFMTIAVPLGLWLLSSGRFTFGGARPVPIVTRNFRNYVRGDLIVSSAGIITNLVLAVGCTLLFIGLGALYSLIGQVGTSTFDTAQRMLVWGIQLNLVLAFFNPDPHPPAGPGSRLFYHLLAGLGDSGTARWTGSGSCPLMIMLLFCFQNILNYLLLPASWGLNHLLNLALPFAVGDGWNIFPPHDRVRRTRGRRPR